MATSSDFRGHEPGFLMAAIPEFLVTASIWNPEAFRRQALSSVGASRPLAGVTEEIVFLTGVTEKAPTTPVRFERNQLRRLIEN
jgi:hypothetical protein